MAGPEYPWLPGFDPAAFTSMLTRSMPGLEQATRIYRELLGLESGSRERSVQFMAEMARGTGADATPLFEAVLLAGPTAAARIAAAAYLAETGHVESVVRALEALQPPLFTEQLVTGLLDVIGGVPATAERVERLTAFGARFADGGHYTTLYLGDLSGRAVRARVRQALAESLLRRDAPAAAAWSTEA